MILVCATLNVPASSAREQPEMDSYRHVAFVGTALTKSTVGQVEFLSGKNWLPTKVGQVFDCEQICRTKADAKAVFQMRSSGSLVRVGENTMIRFCPLDEGMPVASLTGYEAAGTQATVRAVRGTAEFHDKRSSKWLPVRVNSFLPAGASVRTLNKTTVDLFFADSALVMRIHPDSRVTLNAAPLVAAGAIQTNRKPANFLAQTSFSR